MTVTPEDSGAGYAVPDEDAADDEVDVLGLAGQRPPAEGAWLWVTTAQGREGGEFSALFLPRDRPCACGGDVLVRVEPGTSPPGELWPVPAARVRVMAVAAGSVIHVAGWDRVGLREWPETARPAVVFAMSALRELEQHGADPGAGRQVEVESTAGTWVTGIPGLPTAVQLAADR